MAETLRYEKLYEKLKVSSHGFVGCVTFSRPKALNAINTQMMREFGELLLELEKDSNLRCLVLTGEGEKSFMAGADIREMSAMTPLEARKFSESGHSIVLKLQNLHCPVIAAVNGFALGGGSEMALACDIIFASDNAIFGLPEVGLGLIPGFGGTQRLARFVGVAKASELIFSGKKISAQEALSYGLVNRVVPLQQLLSEAKGLAEEIASRAPLAVAAAKRSLSQGTSLALDKGLAIEAKEFEGLFRSKDQKEGLSAFLEKRNPLFVGD